MISVHMLVFDSVIDASFLRSIIENAGARATITRLDKGSALSEPFPRLSPGDVLVILGPSDRQDRAPADQLELVSRLQELAALLSLRNVLVMNLSSAGGGPGLAHLFIARGAQYYLGPLASCDGNALLQYAREFFSLYLTMSLDVWQAHQQANRGDCNFALYPSSSPEGSRSGQFHVATPEEMKSRKKTSS